LIFEGACMNLAPFAFRTAATLGADLRAGRLDACDLVEETLDAIVAHSDQAIFIETTAARARQEALAARARLRGGFALGPLDGVPVAWKDLFDFKGRVTSAGSVVLKSDPPAQRDAALLAAAGRAGLIAVGLVNMTEFAYSGIGLNPHYGTPRNPNDAKTHKAPGGSSSGSGVAVAAGLAPLAIGTDTGGSVRVPASFNGVVGYKSSTGRFPMEGVFPLSRTLDTLGPLAKTVEDCVLADAALRGAIAPEARRGRVQDLLILVPQTLVFDDCQDAVVANFEAAIERLARAGVHIERRALPQLTAVVELIARRGHLLGPEALHLHGERVFGPQADHIDRRVVKRIRSAKDMTAVDLVEVLQSRIRLIAEANAEIGDAFVAFPTTPHVAMPIAALEADDDLFARENLKTLRNTMLGNFLDWCGVAMPSGRDAAGMPTSFLLSAPHGRDTDALSAALTVEALVRTPGA
jgi:aspartyl-tRNA(Asn)/glutamyl-tRNA(Gln) amidotransferase subunit A